MKRNNRKKTKKKEKLNVEKKNNKKEKKKRRIYKSQEVHLERKGLQEREERKKAKNVGT